MSPSRTFIQRPVMTALLMVAILLVGIVAYTQLPVSALPEVDYPTIQVLTTYPGASPDITATTITAPLERQLGEMQGLNQMTSTSSGGVSVIVLQFALSISTLQKKRCNRRSTPRRLTCLPTCRVRPFTASRILPTHLYSRWRLRPIPCRFRRLRISSILALLRRFRS